MANSPGKVVMVQGRIVWISGRTPFEGKPKLDQNTKQPRLNKQGQPLIEYGFGLAVPMSVLNQIGTPENPGPGMIWQAIHEEAYTIYPSRQIPPGFAWKYKDGSQGIDHKGKAFRDREGYADCLVFTCTTTIPIKFYRWENGQNFIVNEGIKCGDYVNVQLQIKAHPGEGQAKAGLYLNPLAVQFLAYGPEIINTPDGDDLFGATAPQIPSHLVGASATPIAPQGMIVPPSAAPGYGAPQAPQAPAMPSFPQAPMQGAQQVAPPHHGVLPGIHQPQAPAPYPSAPSAPPAPAYGQPPAAPGYGAPQAPQAPAMPAPGGYPPPANNGYAPPAVPGYPPAPGYGR